MSKSIFPLVLALAALLLLLAACGGDAPPDLVIPTAAATSVAGPSPTTGAPTAGATAAPLPTNTLPPVPTTILATATAVPPTAIPPTAVPPTAVPPTAVPPPPVPPTATPVPPEAAAATYRVAFVAANDTLNVRRQPDSEAAVVAQLAPNATGIVAASEGRSVRGGGLWLPVDTPSGSGYVNSRFLTEEIDRAAFCADPAVTELLTRLQTAIATQDDKLLNELVHPTRGLRLRLNWWNEEVIVREDEIKHIFDDRARDAVDWGVNEGSGQTIRGTFVEVMLPFLSKDLLGATEWGCDELRHGPTAGMMILPDGYEAVHYYSAYRPAPAEQEFDWGTWVVGVERWEGRYYVSTLIHYRYEI